MTWIRWIGGAACLGLGAWIAGVNWYFNFWKGLVRGKETGSTTPLLGGVLGAVGLMVIPMEGAAAWSGVPFLVDFGSAPFLVWCSAVVVAKGLQRSPPR